MLRINLVLANDVEIDGSLMLSSSSAEQTVQTLYEMKAALERFGISCTWETQRPQSSMTAKLTGLVSWSIIQEKILEVPQLFTDRIPESRVTIAATPKLITLEIALSDEAIAMLYQHGAPLMH